MREVRVSRFVSVPILVFGIACLVGGWLERDFVILGGFFMLGGAYIGMHALYMVVTRKVN